MAKLEESYIVHGAVTYCDFGLRESRLVLEESHGVFLKGLAQVTIKDSKSRENILCFGGCISPENPMTQETAREIAREVEEQTQLSFEEQIVEMFTLQTEEGKQVMACAGLCEPVIVSCTWDKEKEDVSVTAGKKALYGAATLTCKYGGQIRILTAGQPEI